MKKPLLYDAFCGAGGAARGYMNAGFRVIGIDSKPQPHYCGDGFIQMDAFEFFDCYIKGEFERAMAFHCSPPCQGYSIMNNLPWLKGREYPHLILPTMELLEKIGKPYVVENVMGARHGAKGLIKRGLEAHGLKAVWLCGAMFGLPFYRHRLFATNWLWLAPGHPKHTSIIKGNSVVSTTQKKGLTLRPGYEHVPFSMPTLSNWQNGAQGNGVGIGHAKGWKLAAQAMCISWMTRAELTQAIPPAYTEYIGRCLMASVD